MVFAKCFGIKERVERGCRIKSVGFLAFPAVGGGGNPSQELIEGFLVISGGGQRDSGATFCSTSSETTPR